MKQVVVLFLVVFSFVLYSQDTTENYLPPNKHRAAFGLSFSPEYCYRMLTNVDGSQSTEGIIELFKNVHSPKIGFTTGINLLFDLNKLLSLETGLHYSNQGFGVKKIDLSSPVSTSPIATKGILTANYIAIPLKLNFILNKNNTRYFLTLGATSSFLLLTKYTSIYYYQDNTKKRNSQETTGDINQFSISPCFGFGADFNFNEKSRLRIEPTFKFGVIPFIHGSTINHYLWSTGINLCYYIG